MPDSLVGYDNPSHFMLNVFALDEHRLSPMKERLIIEHSAQYFLALKQSLESDISRHYQIANENGCNAMLWSNEGLYFLNSVREYKNLQQLFHEYSSEIVCICCFRDIASYRMSYMQQLKTHGLNFSHDKDSYKYIEPDSWLFDYQRKEEILTQVFDRVIFFPYSKENIVKVFMKEIGYETTDADSIRLNVTKT